MAISIKTNAAPTAVANIAANLVNVNKNSNGYEQSLEAATKEIRVLLGTYAAHATVTKEDFLKLRMRVAMAYQDIREFRNAADRFFIPRDAMTAIDKTVTAKWFADTFVIAKPKKTATMKVREIYNNRRNGIKKALSDVRACYAKGIKFEVIAGKGYVTGESYAKVNGMEKSERVEVTLRQSDKSVTFNQLAAKEDDDNKSGNGNKSVSPKTVASRAITLRNDMEAMEATKMEMLDRLALLNLMFACQAALDMKPDAASIKMHEELVLVTKAGSSF